MVVSLPSNIMVSIRIDAFSTEMLVCKVSRVRIWLFLLTIAPSTLTPSRAFCMREPTASAQSQLISDSEAATRPIDKLLNDPSAESNRFLCWNHVVNVAKSFSSLIFSTFCDFYMSLSTVMSDLSYEARCLMNHRTLMHAVYIDCLHRISDASSSCDSSSGFYWSHQNLFNNQIRW